MRDLDKVLAAMRGGRADGVHRSLGCLVPVTLAIGAAMLPAIGVILALAPIGDASQRGRKSAANAAQAAVEPVAGWGRLLDPFTASYRPISHRGLPHA